MTRLKQLAQIAFVAAPLTGILCATPTYAAGFTLNIPNQSPSSTSFSQKYTETITDDFGVEATLNFMVTAAAGNSVLGTTGGRLGGVVLNITSFTLTAPATKNLTFSSPLLTVIAPYTYTFDPASTSILAQQVLNGQFRSNSTTVLVNPNNFFGFTAQTNTNVATTIISGLPTTLSASNFRDSAFSILTNTTGALNNPTLTSTLGPGSGKSFFLAAGQTLDLPSSACYVVTSNPGGLALLDQIDGPNKGNAAEQACKDTVPPNPPQDVPEPSALLALLGMFGTAAFLKRKQPLQLN